MVRGLSITILGILTLVAGGPASAQSEAPVQMPSPPGAKSAYERGEYAAAYALYRDRLSVCEARFPQRSACLNLLQNSATSAERAGEIGAAERHARDLVATAEALFPDQPVKQISALRVLSSLLRRTEQYAKAEPVYADILATFRGLESSYPQDFLEFSFAAATVHRRLGTANKGLAILQAALTKSTPSMPEGHPSSVKVYDLKAGLLLDLGRAAEAMEVYRIFMPSYLRSRYFNDANASTLLMHQALAEFEAGFSTGAESKGAVALEAMLKSRSATWTDILNVRSNYAGILWGLRRYDEAQIMLENALAEIERAKPGDDVDKATLLNNLSLVRSERGDLDGAVAFQRRALAMRERMYRADHADLVSAMNGLARLLDRSGNSVEALDLAQRAVRMADRLQNPDSRYFSYRRLGEILTTAGQNDRARRAFQTANELSATIHLPTNFHRIRSVAALASALGKDGGEDAAARSHYRKAQSFLFERITQYQKADRRFESDLKDFGTIFTGQVSTAWKLAEAD